jgi:hypothetical protein
MKKNVLVVLILFISGIMLLFILFKKDEQGNKTKEINNFPTSYLEEPQYIVDEIPKILVSSVDGKYLLDINKNEQTKITDNSYNLSPLRKQVIYSKKIDPNNIYSTDGKIYEYDIESGREEIILEANTFTYPHYSPSGKYIYFFQGTYVIGSLEVYNKETKELKFQTSSIGVDLIWVNDDEIIFSKPIRDSQITRPYGSGLDAGSIVKVNLETLEETTLAYPTQNIEYRLTENTPFGFFFDTNVFYFLRHTYSIDNTSEILKYLDTKEEVVGFNFIDGSLSLIDENKELENIINILPDQEGYNITEFKVSKDNPNWIMFKYVSKKNRNTKPIYTYIFNKKDADSTLKQLEHADAEWY